MSNILYRCCLLLLYRHTMPSKRSKKLGLEQRFGGCPSGTPNPGSVQACQAAGVTLMSGYNFRYWKSFQRMKQIWDSGELGAAHHIYCGYPTGVPARLPAYPTMSSVLPLTTGPMLSSGTAVTLTCGPGPLRRAMMQPWAPMVTNQCCRRGTRFSGAWGSSDRIRNRDG